MNLVSWVNGLLRGHKYFQVFLLSLVTAGLTIIPFIITGHGLFTLIDDFNFQQIPFNIQSNAVIKAGNFLWNWNTDLGSSFIGAYSFYTLGSPFFWLSMIFPPSFFPYLIGPLLIVKYCIAGLTAYAYIERYVTNKNYAVIGALLYAFSGFTTVNLMFNHFHDVIALFPLLMVGIDKLVLDRKTGFFAVAVAVNVLLNYFFFIGEVVFLLIYFIVRYLIKDLHLYLRRLPQIILEAVMGVGIGCILFLPSILFTLQNPRTNSFLYGTSSLVYDGNRYLMILKSFFMPADIMSDQSAIVPLDWTSSSAYLPLISLSLVSSYMVKKRNWMTAMLKTLFLIVFIPVLNSLFYVLNAYYYARWFYMLVLILALVSAVVLDKQSEYDIKKGVRITSVITIVLIGYLSFYPWGNGKYGTILHIKLFMIYVLIALSGLAVTWFLLTKFKRKAYLVPLLIACIVLFSTANGVLNIYQMKKIRPDQTSEQIYDQNVRIPEQLKIPDQDYRVDATGVNLNLSMTGNLLSDSSFTSTVNGSIFEFYQLLGIDRMVISSIPAADTMLWPLLSVKYDLTYNQENSEKLIQTISSRNGTVYLYEHKGALPIGFTYQYFLTKSQFMNIPIQNRPFALFKAIVIDDKDIPAVSGLLKPLPQNAIKKLNVKTYRTDLKARAKSSSYYFTRDKQGFTSKIDTTGQRMAFYSVPYDQGWTAKVNGKPVKIVDADGFMSVPVNKGDNSIRFDYATPGLKTGAIISALSLLMFIGYLISLKILRKRNQLKERLDN